MRYSIQVLIRQVHIEKSNIGRDNRNSYIIIEIGMCIPSNKNTKLTHILIRLHSYIASINTVLNHNTLTITPSPPCTNCT